MRRLRLFLPTCLAAAGACTTAPPPRPIRVAVQLVGEECRFVAQGRAMTIDELTTAARAWRGRRVVVNAYSNTPYKCVGGGIFALQRAGVKKTGFVAEPPPSGEGDPQK